MNPLQLPGIGSIVQAVGSVIGDLVTTDKERLDAQIELGKQGIELRRIDAGLLTGQMEVNKAEATNASVWVSGWRPGVGWVGVAAMAYQFLLYPLLTWAWAIMQAKGWVPAAMPPPPMLDTEALWVILTGILGLGTARTVEKVKNVAAR